MKAPLPHDEPGRLAALAEAAVLDTPAEPAFDEIAGVAAETCAAPVSLVTLIDAHRQWFKARIGTRVSETPRDLAMCAHTITVPGLLEVPDTAADPRSAGNPLLTASGIRHYAGAPVVLQDGHAVGSVCVVGEEPRTLGPRERRTLRLLADHAGSLLDRRRQEGRARAAEERLHELERLKATFLATVDHELRTPLSSLSGRLEVLLDSLDDLTPEVVAKHLGVMRRNADRLRHLTDDVSLVAQLDQGGVRLTPAPTDLAAVVRRAVAACEPLAARRGVPVHAVTGAAPVPLTADENRLLQALRHLVVNAITFTVGGGEVVVTVDGSDGTVARIRVADQGIGIPPPLLPRLFEPFQRAPAAYDLVAQGLGLGLTTVRGIVDAHGGTIDVDSAPGVGTTVRMCLPRHP